MKAFLFEYDEQFGGFGNARLKYTLVYANTVEEAYTKLNGLLNPTSDVIKIRLATII